ncbi:hypothetical protein [Thiobacillus sp.]|uniref:hypothetical protein n=1 Tax=Thiobacillus sp. TaxID=924 RepID=UPI0025DBED8E|nr:hypothetical protein [Thiobacillus sp.]
MPKPAGMFPCSPFNIATLWPAYRNAKPADLALDAWPFAVSDTAAVLIYTEMGYICLAFKGSTFYRSNILWRNK